MRIFLQNRYYNFRRTLLRQKFVQEYVQKWFFKRWEAMAPAFAERRNKKDKLEKPRLFWGSMPLINNKYWSNILKEEGYFSETVMSHYFENINERTDFDRYYDEIIRDSPTIFWLMKEREVLWDYIVFDYLLQHYDIFHISCFGLFRAHSKVSDNQAYFLKKFGCKIVLIPYGADFMQYSRIHDYSFRHALMSHYPQSAAKENEIKQNVDYWINHADVLIGSLMIDGGKTKWDILPFCNLSVSTRTWNARKNYSDNDGMSGEVVVVHSPNHRVIKGTSFIINAVKKLQEEGLKVRLLLLEKMKNEQVKSILLNEADILAEQLLIGYALSGIEGMATGVSVISNVEPEAYARVYRRFSYLEECPILSATPENITDQLRILVKNPQLRKELGQAGRKYVEKYHSENTARKMFGKIYEKIWYGKDVDLMSYFDPLNPDSYNNSMPKIDHPLVESKLPSGYYKNQTLTP